jgi:hypothetical protein
MAETEQLDAEGQLTEAKLALGSILGVDAASFTLDDHDAPIDTPCPTVDAALNVMRQTHPSVLRAHGHAPRARELREARRDVAVREARLGRALARGGARGRARRVRPRHGARLIDAAQQDQWEARNREREKKEGERGKEG